MLLKSRIASHLGPTANVTLIDTIPMIRTSHASSQDHIHVSHMHSARTTCT